MISEFKTFSVTEKSFNPIYSESIDDHNNKCDGRKVNPIIKPYDGTFADKLGLEESKDQNLKQPKEQEDKGDDTVCACINCQCINSYCVCYEKGIICKINICKCAEGCRNTIKDFEHNKKRRNLLNQIKSDNCSCKKNKC